jgi:serine/threonine-protein kinase
VPGRFPASLDLAYKAYVQLLRELLRRGDSERLATLAVEFDSAYERLKRDDFLGLARMARAGAAALRNDASAALEQFRQWPNPTLMDPPLAELGIEIVLIAAGSPSGGGTNRVTLRTLYEGLLEPLQLTGLARLGADPFPSH